MPWIITRTKSVIPFLDSENLYTMPCGLHIKFGYGIVLLEILRNTLVFKSGETRSFFCIRASAPSPLRHKPIPERGKNRPSFRARLTLVGAGQGAYASLVYKGFL
jgi:hypothetical protein